MARRGSSVTNLLQGIVDDIRDFIDDEVVDRPASSAAKPTNPATKPRTPAAKPSGIPGAATTKK